MSLITADEVARGGILVVFGGGAGALAMAFPGSLWWTLPALAGVISGAATVPEVRAEVAGLLPEHSPARQLLTTGLGEAVQTIRAGRAGRTGQRAARAPRAGAAQGGRPSGSALPRAAVQRPRWLRVVNDDMDRAPHMLIVGPSGAGKTTLATAAMDDRGGRSVVISPKVAAGNWSGAELITLDDSGSYEPLAQAVADLEAEKRRRIVELRQHGPDVLEPVTVVFDEIQDLTTFVPTAGEFMVRMSSLGRELKMRIVGVGTTDEALNIRGWKASRHNYVRIEMDPNRRATLNDRTETIRVETAEILPRARAARLRPWRGELEPARAPATAPEALLATLMAELPAEIRAAVPDIAPERAARLAKILGGQPATATVKIDRAEGGDVYVFAAAAADGGAARGSRGREDRSAYYQALAALYEAAGTEGRTFDDTYEVHKGTKNIVFPAWQRGHAKWRERVGNARSSRSEE